MVTNSVLDEEFANLAEYGGYLRVEAEQMEEPRWIREKRDGYRWLDPSNARREVKTEEETRTLLRHYDSVTLVNSDDVSDDVRKLDHGLEAFTDGGQSVSEPDQQGLVCGGCGKHVSGSVPGCECVDCGGTFVPATPERLACDRCGDDDASRVHNSEHTRLCEDCVDVENQDNPECPDCERRMIETDPESTPGPQSFECPDCFRALDQCTNCGSPSWLFENPDTGDTECQRCGEVLAR